MAYDRTGGTEKIRYRKREHWVLPGAPAYFLIEVLVHVLLPEIQAFFESEDGQRKFTEWKA